MYIVADIGGTKMRFAASEDLQTFGTPQVVPTPEQYPDMIDAIAEAIRKLSAGERPQDILLGKPQWKRYPAFQADLETKLDRSVHIENDAALVGLGEAVYGAGTGARILMYVTVSTGVNGVRIVDGMIDSSARGFEIGGQYLSMDPKMTMEQLVSGTAVRKAFGVAPREMGKDAPQWEDLARVTAFGVYNSIAHWSPDRVVLGGSMFNEIGISVERVSFHVSDINTKYADLPEIVHAGLGDVGGLYGGIARLAQLR